MQLTTELIDNDIRVSEQNLEQAKASVNMLTGAITVLKNMRAFVAQPESPALSENQLAELVAGPGAKVEEIGPRVDISDENAAIQAADAQRIEKMAEQWPANPMIKYRGRKRRD